LPVAGSEGGPLAKSRFSRLRYRFICRLQGLMSSCTNLSGGEGVERSDPPNNTKRKHELTLNSNQVTTAFSCCFVSCHFVDRFARPLPHPRGCRHEVIIFSLQPSRLSAFIGGESPRSQQPAPTPGNVFVLHCSNLFFGLRVMYFFVALRVNLMKHIFGLIGGGKNDEGGRIDSRQWSDVWSKQYANSCGGLSWQNWWRPESTIWLLALGNEPAFFK